MKPRIVTKSLYFSRNEGGDEWVLCLYPTLVLTKCFYIHQAEEIAEPDKGHQAEITPNDSGKNRDSTEWNKRYIQV